MEQIKEPRGDEGISGLGPRFETNIRVTHQRVVLPLVLDKTLFL